MLTLFFYLLVAATAEPPVIVPLAPVFQALLVEDRGGMVVPLKTMADLNDRSQAVWRPLGVYPVSALSVSPDGRWAAVRVHRGVAVEGSHLDKKAVLLAIEDGQARVAKGITVPRGDVQNLRFVGDGRLRIEAVIGLETGSYAFRRDYHFYDVETEELRSFEQTMSWIGVRDVRAFGDVDYVVQQGPNYFAARFDGSALRKHWQTSDENLGHAILQSPIDLPGRDVYALAGETHVYVMRYERNQHTSWRLNISDKTKFERAPNLTDSSSFPVLGARGLVAHLNRDNVVIEDANGRLRTFDVPHVGSPLTRADGGFIAVQADHPHYGQFFLGDDGTVAPIFARRLIHPEVRADSVSGLTHSASGFADLSLVYVNTRKRCRDEVL